MTLHSTPSWPSHSPIEWLSRLWQSLSIGLEGASHLLFVASCKVEEENKAQTGVILEDASKVNVNNNYICFSSKNSNSDEDGSFSKDKDDNHWEDIADGSQKYTQSLWINIGKTSKAKKKLIKIFAGDVPIPNQC